MTALAPRRSATPPVGKTSAVDVSEAALHSALSRLEQLIDLGESVQGSEVTVPMPRLIPLAMAAGGAVEMLAELGVCPADQLAGFRARLERLGVERSASTASRRGGGGDGTVAGASAASSRPPRGTGGPTSVDAWQRQQIAEFRNRLLPPTDESPAVLPLSRVLGRSGTVAVVLVQANVYTTGVSWSVWTHGRGEHPPLFPTQAAFAQRLGRPAATAPDLTITFDDGRTSVAVDRLAPTGVGDHRPDDVVLLVDSGSGNDDLLRRDHWLTPRPTGPVTIDFAWPEHGLEPTRHVVDLTTAVPPASVWA